MDHARQNSSFSGAATKTGARCNEAFQSGGDGNVETKGQVEVNDVLNLTPENEELILDKLREIVRKCTALDPFKRPTAGEILKILDRPDS